MGQIDLDPQKLADVGRGLRDGADLLQVLLKPVPEVPRLPSTIEDEHRCTLHRVVLNGAGHATSRVENLHAQVVRGDQGSLVVAIGTKNSPFACSPLTINGPAIPSGISAVPVRFSMFPWVRPGS